MTPDTVVMEYPASKLKFLATVLPAHWRYFDFVGALVGWNGDLAQVQVYGWIDPPCLWALRRR
jgi:hypothetical protein